MSGAKRPVESGVAPPHKKRRSPSTSSSSSSGQSSTGTARKRTTSQHGRGAGGGSGSYYSAAEAGARDRRWETVIPDSQSPSPMCKQEKDVKPDPYLSYRSASITSSDTSTFGANGSPSHSSHDVDIKPPRFERSRSLSTESKPSTDEMSRSLSSGSSASAEDGSRNSRDPSDMKLEPGVDYRAPWVGDRLQNPPRILGFGPRPQPSPRPPAIRDESLSHFNVDRDRSRAPSPIREEDLPKEEQDDQSMATFGDMPPPRAPLSRTMELDSRKRERSMTASEDGHYPEMDDTASRTRAGSARSELEMQEDRADSGTAEGSQRSSSPQYGEDWLQEGEVAAEEEQGMVEIELEATPETDPAVTFLSSFLPSGPQPIGVKARLQNELARSTAQYDATNRVLPIEYPASQPPQTRPPPLLPSHDLTMDDDDTTPTPRTPSPRPPSPSPSPSPPPAPAPEPAMAAARGLSPAPECISILDAEDDDLDDYDEEQNAPSGGGLGDILAPQAHYEAPTQDGTVHRWYLVLLAPQGKVIPMQEDLNYAQLAADISLLQSYDIPLPHGVSFLPHRRYLAPGSDGHKLLTEMPGGDPSSLFSRTTLDEMWEDFSNEGDEYRHRPRWEPEKVEWEETLKKMAKEGVEVQDLLQVLEEVFSRGRRSVDEELLREIHRKNWLWFDQLRQLARVQKGYFALASNNIIIEAHTLHQKLKASWSAEVEAKTKKLKAARGGDREEYKELLNEASELKAGQMRNRIDALGALAERLRRIDEKKSRMEEQRA